MTTIATLKEGILSQNQKVRRPRMNSNSKNKIPFSSALQRTAIVSGRQNQLDQERTTNDSLLCPTTNHGSRNGKICQKLSGRV
jgi:hypothetical protein